MILVNNQPLDSSKKKEAGSPEQWYYSEVEKIQRKREPVVIKKLVEFRLDAQGKRHAPPAQGISSKQEVHSERGTEMWACCTSYKKNKDETFSFTPNSYFLKGRITLDPRTQVELIFFFTCIVNLAKYGYAIDNPEKDAEIRLDKESAELDVKYAIQRQLDDLDNLRFIAKAWGITAADKMTESILRVTLFDIVKESEKNYNVTKRGYKEFMDDMLNTNPEVTEMRVLVNTAIDKGVLEVNRMTRKVIYTLTKDTLFIVPLDYMNRVNDYVADMLPKKQPDLVDTIKEDLFGPAPVIKISIADLEGMKTRDELKRAAKKLKVIVPPAMKDETIREKCVKAVTENVQ